MLFRTQSAAVYGIDADLVDIEVDLTPARGESDSPSSVTIVGLPDAAVRESRERIRAAITNCAFFFQLKRICSAQYPVIRNESIKNKTLLISKSP